MYYVMANVVPSGTPYITPSKFYEVSDFAEYVIGNTHKIFGSIIADNGVKAHIVVNGCPHLNKQSWNLFKQVETA